MPLIASLVLLAAVVGCADRKETPSGGAAAGAESAAAAAAPAAPPSPVAGPASTAAEPPAAAAAPDPAAAPAPAAAAPAGEDPAIAEKRLAVEFALDEEKLATDPRGQWAVTAKASSTYGDAKDPADYSASKATGAPDVANFGDNGQAWTAKEADGGIERLEVTFAKPVQATEIRIRQNSGPGALIKVELIDTTGASHAVHEGVDTAQYDKYNFWFRKSFEKTAYKVAGAKLTLATNVVPSWNEIDAVQLIGE
jgi:hypothetical protein